MLTVIETHPVQYHAPVYRAVARLGVPVTAIYGSDFSARGYRDREFGADVAWNTDLLDGYDSTFLSRVEGTEAREPAVIQTAGLREALRQTGSGAVLILGYSPRFHRVAWREALRARRPVLFRGEVSDTRAPRARWFEVARSTFLRSMYARSAAMLYIGRRARDHFERLGVSESRLFFSPYCVDTTPFDAAESNRTRLRADTRARLALTAEQPVVLYAGKLSERKGLGLLLPAISALARRRGEQIGLVFMGDGALRRDLEEARVAWPDVDVRFPGVQPQQDVSGYYHAADALVLPSRHSETWGLVVNEALHHGVRCVVSDAVGCAPDLIQDGMTGYVFDNGSPPALVEALGRALALSGPAVRDACRHHVMPYSVENAAGGIVEACAAVTRGALR